MPLRLSALCVCAPHWQAADQCSQRQSARRLPLAPQAATCATLGSQRPTVGTNRRQLAPLARAGPLGAARSRGRRPTRAGNSLRRVGPPRLASGHRRPSGASGRRASEAAGEWAPASLSLSASVSVRHNCGRACLYLALARRDETRRGLPTLSRRLLAAHCQA